MKIKLPYFLALIFILTFLLTTYIYLVSYYLSQQNQKQGTKSFVLEQSSTEKVTRVIDGDTFEIEGGIKVRLTGVDSPEMKNGNIKIDCFALESKEKLTSLILNKEVILVKDVSETDKYGRLLRYAYIDNILVNETMISEGYARVSTFSPDVRFAQTLIKSQQYAKAANLGLWSSCQ